MIRMYACSITYLCIKICMYVCIYKHLHSVGAHRDDRSEYTGVSAVDHYLARGGAHIHEGLVRGDVRAVE